MPMLNCVPLNNTSDFSVDAEIWYSPFILLKSHSTQGNLQSYFCPVPSMSLWIEVANNIDEITAFAMFHIRFGKKTCPQPRHQCSTLWVPTNQDSLISTLSYSKRHFHSHFRPTNQDAPISPPIPRVIIIPISIVMMHEHFRIGLWQGKCLPCQRPTVGECHNESIRLWLGISRFPWFWLQSKTQIFRRTEVVSREGQIVSWKTGNKPTIPNICEKGYHAKM